MTREGPYPLESRAMGKDLEDGGGGMYGPLAMSWTARGVVNSTSARQ